LQYPGNNPAASATNPASSFPSNSLVLDQGTIYLIQGTTKYGFTSLQAFKGLGYSLKYVVSGDTSTYQPSSLLLSSPTQAHPPGSWLLRKKTVYYSSSAGLIGVPSWTVFLDDGGKASYLVHANAADLAQPLQSPLLSAPDSRVAEQ
jgi:hypothetical protein